MQINPRLFDLQGQLDFRRGEIAKNFGLEPESVSYDLRQDFLVAGWMSTEMYFSTTGRIDAKESELTSREGVETYFIPFEHLKDLIHNQGRLSGVNPNGYRPEDPREMPLIDESLAGLIWGYEALTGEKLDISETVGRLNSEGMNVRVYDTSPKTSYDFPTSF